MNLTLIAHQLRQMRIELQQDNDAAEAKAERNEQLREGLKAYPASAFKTPVCDMATIERIINRGTK